MNNEQNTQTQINMLPINSNEPDTAIEIMDLVDLKTGIENPDVIVEIFYRVRKDNSPCSF